MATPPRIAITPGEPAGIGPDVCLKLSLLDWPCELVFIADPDLLEQRAQQLGINIKLRLIDLSQPAKPHRPGVVNIFPVSLMVETTCGQLNTKNAQYVLNTLQAAAQLCLDKTCSAVVTGPVQKSVINEAGVPFSGHTEFFAEYCQADPVMMLTSEEFRVALVTTHLPLNVISETITAELLTQVIHITHHDLINKFNIKQPRLAVCGLNPHAGENGHLGDEEIKTIIPTLNTLRKEGIHLTGPLPADTIFNADTLHQHDVIIGMYHDQVLPTLKYAGFGNAVNITLGLPIIRTSVDHGTALELAGSGKAKHHSLQAALKLAIELSLKKE